MNKIVILNQTELMKAIEAKNDALVEAILSTDIPDINAIDSQESNALFYAIRNNREDIAFKLIEKGIDIYFTASDNINALFYACFFGMYKLAEYLINAGVPVNSKMKMINYTPLHFAASNGYKDIVILLLEHGADINEKDMYNMTAADHAKYDRNEELYQFLLNYKTQKKQKESNVYN